VTFCSIVQLIDISDKKISHQGKTLFLAQKIFEKSEKFLSNDKKLCKNPP